MKTTMRELEKLQQIIKESEEKLMKNEGKKEALLTRIKTEFNCVSIRELREKKTELEIRLSTLKDKSDRAKKELESFVEANDV